MTLIDKYKFEKYDFSLYFLASLKPGETYDLTPGTKEAHAYLWDCDRVTLELTVSLLLSSLLLYSDLALLRSLSPKVVEGVYSNGKWFELGGEDSPAVALDARQYKFFAQYAGWSPGQLERFVLSIFL